MKIKENIHIIIIASVGFLVFYSLLAVRPLSQELQLTPQWTTSILHPVTSTVNKTETQIPFRLGQNMGYFTVNGEISLMESFPFQATISEAYRASYSQDASRIPVYEFGTASNAEYPDFFIEGTGFPFFSEDRVYLFNPGGYGLAQYTKEDGQIWQFEHTAPIVAFNSSPAGTAVGYADGTIYTFSSTGELVQTFEPGGSTYPIILGIALSSSGGQLACISGIDQQRFVLTQQRNGVNKVVFHTYLETNQREPVLVQFTKDENHVFYSAGNGLGIVNCFTFENKVIPVEGTILAIEECPTNNITCVLTRDKGRYNIYFIENRDVLVGHFGFKADAAFIDIQGGDLYVGRDTQISKINITRK